MGPNEFGLSVERIMNRFESTRTISGYTRSLRPSYEPAAYFAPNQVFSRQGTSSHYQRGYFDLGFRTAQYLLYSPVQLNYI